MGFRWFFNATNSLVDASTSSLEIRSVQPSNAGTYTVVISNDFGSVTSPPALLSVIAPVERRIVPAIALTADPGTTLNLDYSDQLFPTPGWSSLEAVPLTTSPQRYFDLSKPLPPQRFYRGWQTNVSSLTLSLDLQMIPALTLTSNVSDSIRVDGINQFGPIDAWFPLATVTLTNTSQLYFDITSPGRPTRLYRLVPLP